MKTFALAALLAVGLGAQETQPPAFRSGADIVEVDAVVRDKNGRFVEDLKPEDFEVREEGHPETIDLFYVVGASTPSPTAAPAVPPPAAAASPIVAAPPRTPRVFVVVFDDDHLTAGGFKRVQAAALALFTKYFQPGDIGGVLAGGRMINNRLTSDREELLKAVRSASPSLKNASRKFDEQMWPRMSEIEAVRIQWNNDGAVLGETIKRACVDEPTLCPNAEIAVKGRAAELSGETQAITNLTIQMLAGLFNGLARVEGRKAVVLMSEGFIAEESWPLVRQAVGLAARANTHLYTIDARGLDTHGMADHLSGADPGANDAVSRMLNQLDEGADAMNSLAVDTGGFVVRNTNILDAAVGRIVDDASHYYVLGYRPEIAADGKFRKISVKVKRQGVSVRARSGYVATPKAAVPTTSTLQSPRADAPGPEPAKPDVPAPPILSPSIAESETLRAVPGDPARADAAQPDATHGDFARDEPVARRANIITLHIRPDAARHVEALAGSAADADATAGWTAYQRGDVESARTALTAAAARPGARPWVQYALGQSQYALRDYTGAIASWEHVRTSAPEFEPVYFDLVDGYIQVKDPDKAIRVLRDAKRRWTKDSEVDNALGVVQAAHGSLDDAVQSFSEAVAAAPQEGIGYFNLAKTLELRYRRNAQRARRVKQVVSASDRDKAIANYKRYLEIGGPLADSAREGLARLGWQ